jgi:hypothetical protein
MNLLGPAILPLWIRRGNPGKSPELPGASLFDRFWYRAGEDRLPGGLRLDSSERGRPVTADTNV